MTTAVVRVMVDAEGLLAATDFESGVKRLESLGYEVVASPVERLPDRSREIELIVEGGRDELPTGEYTAACEDAFGTVVSLGVVTYISRGTDDDARGVLRRFRVPGQVMRSDEDGEEVVTVTIAFVDMGRVPESRLHTALEAALNCEVRIVVIP
jgi:hypothetical protein